MSIKLLMPKGSLLESRPEVIPHLRGYDTEALTWRWDFAFPETEVLQKELEAIAANASDCGQETVATLEEMRMAMSRALRRPLPNFEAAPAAPRLTESWFCCAEPTAGQGKAVGLTIGRLPIAAMEGTR
jgi:hypothetical protein